MIYKAKYDNTIVVININKNNQKIEYIIKYYNLINLIKDLQAIIHPIILLLS